MGITKLSKSGFTSSSYEKYNDFLAGNTAFNPTSYESIATVTVGSGGASNVEFTSIPGTYTHLQVRAIVRNTTSAATGAEASLIRFNSDTGSNYSRHSVNANGVTNPTSPTISTSASVSQTSSISGPVMVVSSALTSAFSIGIVDILDYQNTNKNKTIRTLTGGDANTDGGWISLYSGLWMNTSAITSITFIPTANNYAQYSQFALYGIRGA